ncbi:MAG: hypothetical protein WBG90_02965 [Saonia sp.]
MTAKIFKLGLSFAITLAMLVFVSCSDSDDSEVFNGNNSGQTSFKVSSSFNSVAGKKYLSETAKSSLEITSFLVNIEELELELDDDDRDDEGRNDDAWDDDGYYGSDDEIELKGPFELDLLAGEFVFATVDVPQARYEELEFEFDESDDSSSELYEKTILVKGTIDGIPFEFWHDFEEEVEIDFEDSNSDISITNGSNSIVINFDLDGLFDDITGIDLSEAIDGDDDGLIEINPNDDDGNGAIADELKNKLEDYIDLLDD